MCVNNQALSGHYYATAQSTPPRTNPVSIRVALFHGLWFLFNFVNNQDGRGVERCLMIVRSRSHSLDENIWGNRAIFLWPWNGNARTKQKPQTNGNRAVWLVYQTTNARGFWLMVKRTLRWNNLAEVFQDNCVDEAGILTEEVCLFGCNVSKYQTK